MPATDSRFTRIGTVAGTAASRTAGLAGCSSFDRTGKAAALASRRPDYPVLHTHCHCYIDSCHSLCLLSCYNFGCPGKCRDLALRWLV